MSILKLKDDIQSVDFINDTGYDLMDNTFNAQIPQRRETRIDSLRGGSTRDLLTSSYGLRTVNFDFRITGSSDSDVHSKITAITQMLVRSSAETYLSGGGYSASMSTTEGDNTGDSGLVLEYQMKVTSTSITNEDGDSDTDTGKVIFRVVTGDIVINNQLSASRSGADLSYYATGSISLECEPFALGVARIIGSKSGQGYWSYPVTPDNTHTNKMFIDAVDVPGDAPALTRIYTQIVGGMSIIIARDAGVSILNSTTVAAFTGAGKNDMLSYGQSRNDTAHKFRVRIVGTGTPDTFQWSDDNGSSYTSAANIVAKTPTKLGSYDVYVYFASSTGHTAGEYWSFVDSQSVLDAGGTATDLYTNRDNYYAGSSITGAASFTIPPGCMSKYRVYAHVSTDIDMDLQMQITFTGNTSTASTDPMKYPWIRTTRGTAVDLGVLDLSPKVLPFMSHPGAFAKGRIKIHARALEDLSSGDEVTFYSIFLVPAQDEYAYLHAAWDLDDTGREVYCNYDPNNPYIAEVSNNHMDSATELAYTVGLDYTNAGSVITLIPNVDNTLLFLPLYSVASYVDWRTSIFSSSTYSGEVSVAIRPRYLYGG